MGLNFSRPFRTYDLSAFDPVLKHRAIHVCSFGTTIKRGFLDFRI